MRKFIATVLCMVLLCNFGGCATNSETGILTLYLVRHGQTDTNVQGLMVGQSGNPQLTDAGRNNALKLGNGLSEVKFDAAYSSELSRAYDTANLILDGAKQQLTVRQKKEFNDISWGDAEGMTWDEIANKYGVSDFSQCFGNISDRNFSSPMNAESTFNFCERFEKGIGDIISEQDGGDVVLIVAHSSLAFYLQSIFPDSQISNVDNTSVTVVTYDYDEEKFELEDFNDTTFLEQ